MSDVFVPNSPLQAGRELRMAFKSSLPELPKRQFVRTWCAIAYLFPGLHPEGFESPDNRWTCVLKRFAAEAWRRADAGELSDDELYACDSQWCGVFDRMLVHLPEETERRVTLAASFGR